MVNPEVLEIYRGVSDRTIDLVEKDQGARLPSCPLWSAMDLLRHVTAVCQDWVEHRLDGYGTERWTQEGVQRLSSLNFGEVSLAWRMAIDQMVSLTEEPEDEIPVAQTLVERYSNRIKHANIPEVNFNPINSFHQLA